MRFLGIALWLAGPLTVLAQTAPRLDPAQVERGDWSSNRAADSVTAMTPPEIAGPI